MPDVLLFGATGYAGRLTAQELHRHGASFAIAGPDANDLATLASTTGDPEVQVVADVDSLVRALRRCSVLVACVGPWDRLGWTAVAAALRAGVHYVDCAGEQAFVGDLVARCDRPARRAGIAMAPCMELSGVAGEVAASLATAGMTNPEVTVTYAPPRPGSGITVTSLIESMKSPGAWLEDGRRLLVRPARHERWAPMPAPLGPSRAISFPLALGHLAPLHLDAASFRLFVTTSAAQRLAIKGALPLLRMVGALPAGGAAVEQAARVGARRGPPSKVRAARWMVLAEARSGPCRRNVGVAGNDTHGLTARLLAASALRMAGADRPGVLAPVQAVGLDFLTACLGEAGVAIETYGPN
jgi:short subunit dehydrogenase-like uncharacterized protein